MSDNRKGYMFRMRSLLTALALAGAAALGLAAPAAAQGAEKYPLVGPAANIFCSDLTPAGEDVSQLAPGFVVFNANKNKVSAVVSVKDAPPGKVLPVRLIQGGVGGGNDCYAVDGVITTNAQGNGTINVAEAPAGTRAQVIIDTSELFGTPTFRGTEIFVFAE
jgi:hypothetical protein